MVDHNQDNCPSSYDHVMQWYESGAWDSSFVKNTGFPTEAQCFHCDTAYPQWGTTNWDYSFTFPSPNNYQEFLLQTATPLQPTGANFSFDSADHPRSPHLHALEHW
jgi:hypothetical protein